MLPALHAEEQFAAIEAASVPYMKEDGQRAVFRRLQRQLRSLDEDAEPQPQGLHAALQGTGRIPTRRVPKAVSDERDPR